VPWRESSPMSERLQFVQACMRRRGASILEICARFGISEKTGHKYLRRFAEAGAAGLADRSHAPHHPTHGLAPAVAARLVALRKRFPRYGPVKLRDWLMQNEPARHWPAPSTIGDLLKRQGLVRARSRRARVARRLEGRTAATMPNDVWTVDFKGEFRLTSGPYCYPLTVLDLYSHFLLGCEALASPALRPTQQVFVQLFRAYGLPRVIRSDNGVPFAQPNAMGRLGALAFWWVRLGIRPEHTTPGRPADNGAHERFHKTLKAGATRPASASFSAQQRRFERFQREYNRERPHAALPGHWPPARVYHESTREYPRRLPAIVYPDSAVVRLVTQCGAIKWRNHTVFLTRSLAGEYVALTETADDLLTITYGALALGELEPARAHFTPLVRWVG